MRNGTMELTLKIAGVPVEEFVHAKETCALLAPPASLQCSSCLAAPAVCHHHQPGPPHHPSTRHSPAPSLLHR